ncbi:phosphate acetyltransferase [Buchnera aphidicola]|uniref:phosphate acetyltransferase n=1 Tax=Buchnera aphidicola TaxID=9 RepID=UPI0034648F34
MLRTIMLIPIGKNVEITTSGIGLVKAITDQNLTVCFFKPIVRYDNNKIINNTTNLILKNDSIFCIEPIKLIYTESFFNINYTDILIDKIVSKFYKYKNQYDILVIEGFRSTEIGVLSNTLNYKIATILNAEIVFIMQEDDYLNSSFVECTYFLKRVFKEDRHIKTSGLIINSQNKKINKDDNFYKNKNLFFKKNKLRVLAVIPCIIELVKIPIIYLFQCFNMHIIDTGIINCCFIENIIYFDQDLFNLKDKKTLNSIFIVSFDQCKYIHNIYLDKIKKNNIIAIILTGIKGDDYHNTIFFNYYRDTGIPIFSIDASTIQILSKLHFFSLKVNYKDSIKIEKIKSYVSGFICRNWLSSLHNAVVLNKNVSPNLFTYHLIKLSNKIKKRIVLPEGYDSRIIQAASICQKKGIADCILLGNPKKIYDLALKDGIDLENTNNIIDPKKIRNNYINRLVSLRSHKGMTFLYAKEMMKNNIILATLMLENNDVDGMVSGVINTTANTIRPALQLIKMKDAISLVSSLFFMLTSNKVLIYADCAINTEPNAKELADIAIQSADSAKLFGIDPKIAMISYSTYTSGFGQTVDKVREATSIARKRRPDLIIDGPLQYDAATIPEIAIVKAPKSCVAGYANILIFPDLNTGNTVYKAVQRLAKVIAIGPILQGLKKPVNDLSRGAMVEDIIYTIAITAIQSI